MTFSTTGTDVGIKGAKLVLSGVWWWIKKGWGNG